MRAIKLLQLAVLLLSTWELGADAARAASVAAPPPVVIPQQLTLPEALQLLRTRGLDVLLADATVLRAEGDVKAAAAINNPGVASYAGPAFNYRVEPSCRGCQAYTLGGSFTDNGALFDSVVGKRALRREVAAAALSAARLGRADALRTLEYQVKRLYLQLALAQVGLNFATEMQASMSQTLELNRPRYPKVIDEGTLARIEVQELAADQAVDAAHNTLRQAQVDLAFLIGQRTATPNFTVAAEPIKFHVPTALVGVSEATLVHAAQQARPDLRADRYQKDRSRISLTLARRQQFPEVDLQLQYSQMGTGPDAAQPPSLAFGLAFNLPVFYQQQGELRRAQATLLTQDLQYVKRLAQIRAEVGGAFSAYRTSREQVERLLSGLLPSAQTTRDIVTLQYRLGAATLMDFLGAQRTYITTNQEYFQVLGSYWTAVYQLEQAVGAVYQLEQAVGVELRK